MKQPPSLCRRTWLIWVALLNLMWAPCAMAQKPAPYPARPLHFIVVGPPGGLLDLAARALAHGLQGQWGQPVVVENKAGGAGLIGAQAFMQTPQDGYTFLLAPNGLVSEVPHVVRVPATLTDSLRPLVEIARTGLVLVVHPTVAARNLAEFVAIGRAHPGRLSYGSYSPGTVSHTLGLELNQHTGLDMIHVGYRGSPLLLQDLMAGQVQAAFDGVGNVAPLIASGRLRALATTNATRLALLPDVPTFAELGHASLTETVWLAVWTTPGVPAAVLDLFRQAALKTVSTAAFKASLERVGMQPGSGAGPAELSSQLKAASARQAAKLQAIGFKPE